MYVVETLSTEDCPAAERGEWWRDLVSTIHCPMRFALSADYDGRIQHQRTETHQLVRWWGNAEQLVRRAPEINEQVHDAFELLVPINGRMAFVQSGDGLVAGPAMMALVSLDVPFEFRHGDDFSAMALIVPRSLLEPRLAEPVGGGTLVDASRGLGRLVVDQLQCLHRERDALDGPTFDAVADRLVDLIAMAVNRDVPGSGAHSTLLTAIRRYVRQHAHDPELSGAHVAAELGWSLRTIQSHLHSHGTTPSELIRNERLALARSRLQDPAWLHRSISTIARASGFADMSTFCNSYRRTFGERASDARPSSVRPAS